ncbi:MAG: phytanoyl-CoA dioxygenase [Planctomycetaceae bacterium]|nr:phytanoyl-CoA dioxygenase [Planctomycetaceae bacterium]
MDSLATQIEKTQVLPTTTSTTDETNKPTQEPVRRFDPIELEQFHHDGYVIARGLLSEKMRREMLQLVKSHVRDEIQPIEYEAEVQYPGAPQSLNAEGGRTARRLKQAHSRHSIFTDWIQQPSLVARLNQLLGPEIVMPLAHHNCVMTKQPQFSSDTGWHQDIRYWSFQRPELVSVWAALGSENRDNGCLQLIPGSHRVDFHADQFDDATFFRSDLPENADLIQSAVPAELEAGDVLFFHSRTLHAATRNHSKQTKYSVVMTFRSIDNPPIEGTRSSSLPEMLISQIS